MKVSSTHGYYAEDVIRWPIVRAHLRYGFGENDDLIKHYTRNAIDYVASLIGVTLSSPTFPVDDESPDDPNGTVARVAPAYGQKVIHFGIDELQKQGQFRLGRMGGSWSFDKLTLSRESASGILSTTVYEAGIDDATSETILEYLAETMKLRVYRGAHEWIFDTEDFSKGDLVDSPIDQWAVEIVLKGGQDARELSPRFRQAVLLLVGHYDMNREAEYTGGISTELKEGVRRLVSSMIRY